MKAFKLLTLVYIILNPFFIHAQDFVTIWDMNAALTTSEISFGAETNNAVAYTWETIPAGANGSGFLNGPLAVINGLPATGAIRLSISPNNFKRIRVNAGLNAAGLLEIEQWGSVNWSNMDSAFFNCKNLQISASDVPDLSTVSSMKSMLANCYALTGPSNLNLWNTSTVTNMSNLFAYDTLFNQNIGNWNTGNVTNMSGLLSHCYLFNQALNNWNTSNVSNMSNMFRNAKSFNQALNSWNTSNVSNMSAMFLFAESFNGLIDNWNTGLVTDMSYMFNYASQFNQPIGNWNTGNVVNMKFLFSRDSVFNQPLNWNTSKVEDMSYLFESAVSFNQPIDNWNVSEVTMMRGIFNNALSFNQSINSWNTGKVVYLGYAFNQALSFNKPLNNWNTANVIDMEKMFFKSIAFNQPLDNWNTSFVQDMRGMFAKALSFNQKLSSWRLDSITASLSYNGVENMLDSCGMDCYNYSNTLVAWSNDTNIKSGLRLGSLKMKYDSLTIAARNNLMVNKAWIFIGDSLSLFPCYPLSVQTLDAVDNIGQCYPNPTNGSTQLSISSNSQEVAEIFIRNLLTQVIYRSKRIIKIGNNNIMLSTENFANGQYMVVIKIGDKTTTRKLIINK